MNGQEEAFLGVSIGSTTLAAVELRTTGTRTVVTRLRSLRLDRELAFSLEDEDGQASLASAMSSVIEGRTEVPRVALAISDRLALVKCVPVDRGMEKEEVAEHVRWEVEQLVVASREEYRVDSSYVAMPDGGQDRLVVVAIRKPIIEFLKGASQRAGLRLVAIDLDLFAGVRAVTHNHQLRPGSTTAVLRLLPEVATIAFLRDGEFFDEGETALPDRGALELGARDQSFARELWEGLERRSGSGKVERVLVYGTACEELAPVLQQRCALPVEVVNPFQRLELSPEVAGVRPKVGDYELVAATGAALRGVPRSRV
ncbi:MAG: pilus assembly protein PilM [bacterium]|nr:pilus assembly protein PilM [candidate division KSB1 bacterium]MDH7561170.1 pilus assembly protein PilM [bacterium]